MGWGNLFIIYPSVEISLHMWHKYILILTMTFCKATSNQLSRQVSDVLHISHWLLGKRRYDMSAMSLWPISALSWWCMSVMPLWPMSAMLWWPMSAMSLLPMSAMSLWHVSYVVMTCQLCRFGMSAMSLWHVSYVVMTYVSYVVMTCQLCRYDLYQLCCDDLCHLCCYDLCQLCCDDQIK
jgi:hypothetical protein